MNSSGISIWLRATLPATAAGLLLLSGTVMATEQSQQRQQGRSTNQAAKHDARSTKQDCRADNKKSNAACRHDKRDTKQQGRQDKRDIKY
jgi:uncharacterized membrane protein